MIRTDLRQANTAGARGLVAVMVLQHHARTEANLSDI